MLTTDQPLKAIRRMSPISPAAHRITELLARPHQSVNVRGEDLQAAPVAKAQDLEICNSAYFSLPVKLISVPRAINMRGAQRLVDIVLLISLRMGFKRDLEGYGMAGEEL